MSETNAFSSRCPDHMIVAMRPILMSPTRAVQQDFWEPTGKHTVAFYRKQYDAGVIELAQARHEDMMLLYAIPRREKRKARGDAYFKMDRRGIRPSELDRRRA